MSVESWPGVLQVTQKHIKSWKVGHEAEMGFPMSEAYGLPLNAKSNANIQQSQLDDNKSRNKRQTFHTVLL